LLQRSKAVHKQHVEIFALKIIRVNVVGTFAAQRPGLSAVLIFRDSSARTEDE
jgi:hypothetical protein